MTYQLEIHSNKTSTEAALAAEKLRQKVNPMGFKIMRRDGKTNSSGKRARTAKESPWVIIGKHIISVYILLI